MMRTIRRKVLGMKMEAMRSEQGIISSTVIFFCLHDIHPCYSVFNHLCLQLCLPTQRIDVKNPLSMMNCHIYTPLLLLPVFIHPCSLICTSSICMQWWCGVQGVLCRSITKYCSILKWRPKLSQWLSLCQWTFSCGQQAGNNTFFSADICTVMVVKAEYCGIKRW